jgi:hypothetical protein
MAKIKHTSGGFVAYLSGNPVKHITIYRENGRFAGWPANYGIWSWGDEIVLGFTLGYHKTAGGFHARDKSRPFVSMQARSLDGGQTWESGSTPCKTPGNRGLSADEHMDAELALGEVLDGENAPADPPGGIDFSHPDFALMCARTGLQAGARSFFYSSTDRCRSWDGPFKLPMYGQTAIAARTDYLISGPRECTLFLTANKRNGEEGRVFCARTTDGGKTFDFLAWIGTEPEGYAIMPASVRLSASRILVAVRCRGAPGNLPSDKHWIDLYASEDDGASWYYLNRPVPDTGRGGNPPTLTQLRDGRLCLTYGYRAQPFSICARLSADGGETWSETIVLRNDGGCHDLGYPRTVQRPDGTIVTAYYFNDEPDGERYIAATLWRP